MLITQKDGSDLDYLAPKLREIRGDGEKTIAALVQEFKKRRGFELDAHEKLRWAVQTEYRATLQRMSRLIIDMGWEEQSNAIAVMRGIASGMAYVIMQEHHKWFFVLPNSSNIDAWKRDIKDFDVSFDEIAKSVADDLQRGIVGSERYIKKLAHAPAAEDWWDRVLRAVIALYREFKPKPYLRYARWLLLGALTLLAGPKLYEILVPALFGSPSAQPSQNVGYVSMGVGAFMLLASIAIFFYGVSKETPSKQYADASLVGQLRRLIDALEAMEPAFRARCVPRRQAHQLHSFVMMQDASIAELDTKYPGLELRKRFHTLGERLDDADFEIEFRHRQAGDPVNVSADGAHLRAGDSAVEAAIEELDRTIGQLKQVADHLEAEAPPEPRISK